MIVQLVSIDKFLFRGKMPSFASPENLFRLVGMLSFYTISRVKINLAKGKNQQKFRAPEDFNKKTHVFPIEPTLCGGTLR